MGELAPPAHVSGCEHAAQDINRKIISLCVCLVCVCVCACGSGMLMAVAHVCVCSCDCPDLPPCVQRQRGRHRAGVVSSRPGLQRLRRGGAVQLRAALRG